MKATVKVTVKVNTKNTPHPKEKDKGISLMVWGVILGEEKRPIGSYYSKYQ